MVVARTTDSYRIEEDSDCAGSPRRAQEAGDSSRSGWTGALSTQSLKMNHSVEFQNVTRQDGLPGRTIISSPNKDDNSTHIHPMNSIIHRSHTRPFRDTLQDLRPMKALAPACPSISPTGTYVPSGDGMRIQPSTSHNVLAIQTGHNSGLALFQDGQLTLAVSEEKFTNKKNQGGFPFHALDAVDPRLKLSRVIVCGEFFLADVFQSTHYLQEASMGPLRWLWDMSQLWIDLPKWPYRTVRNWLYQRLSRSIRPRILKELENRVDVAPGNICFRDHHTLHCLSPITFYNLSNEPDPILSISLDGDGDKCSGKVFRISRGFTELISSTPYDGSLGYFFGEVTNFLGMRALEHEYKVMGLAAYVEPKQYEPLLDQMRELAQVDEDALRIKPKFNLMLLRYWLRSEMLGKRFDKVAAAAQAFLEELVLKLVKASIKRTGIRRLAFSGGVFMNVKLNQKIAHLPEVDHAWFMPGSGDESLPIGAGTKCRTDGTVYQGPSYTDEEVESYLRTVSRAPAGGSFSFDKIDDIEQMLADLLAQGMVVARFKGRSEWGPRALGNRSILADPSKMENFHQVNDQIKCRDFWMPFSPSLLEETASVYLADWDRLSSVCSESMKHMTVTANSTPLARKQLVAAMHQRDKTIRPQILARADNPSYYRLIELFKARTGIGGLLNTSMNIHGYPMVATLEQAMSTFLNSGLQFMAIESFLVSKRNL